MLPVMHWVRLDSGFPSNHKVLQLVGEGRHRAIVVYVCGLAYAGAQGLEGWVPKAALPLIHGRTIDAKHLVDVGLWVPRPGGWDVHDWLDYQPSNEANATRSARARAAALARWNRPHTMPDAMPDA